jgi:hypothetical protein
VPYPCRRGRTFPGAGAAASTVDRGAAAHRELHGSLRRTRPPGRHPKRVSMRWSEGVQKVV